MGTRGTFANIGRKPKLADLVVGTLRKRISNRDFRPGEKLPTESELTTIFGVSRTVIREAIAALAADGLVQSRQGAGMFVMKTPATSFAEIGAGHSNKISVAINILEVRMGVEIEAAGFAAQRRSESQVAAIQETWDEFDRLLARSAPTGKTDFAFHRAVAVATNNPFYVEVLEGLGDRTIQCDVASPWGTESVLSYEYQAGLQQEHGAILQAIVARDVDGARESMRKHLALSLERYATRLQLSR
jgi:GntR family transcriptional repressor for pyruvate dehydrogenase complex